jgi:threonine/homoserine/homoserine lactone efflux protein
MSLFWQGLLLGLSLSILAGPMLFILLQIGMEKGFRAGAMAGMGVWMSDLMYVLLAYFGISYLLRAAQWDGFQLWASLLGGVVLIILGAGTIMGKPVRPRYGRPKEDIKHNWLGYWLRGFIINTLNPFTAFFWIGVMTTVSANGVLLPGEATLFFGTVILVVLITDLLKVLLAKNLHAWMKLRYLFALKRVSGSALVMFGIVLMIRGLIM